MQKRYTIIVIPKAQKDLDYIPDKFLLKIKRVFEVLATDPYLGKKLDGEYKNYYTIRAWPYRIIYEIKEIEVIISVIRIKHRKDVYK